MGEKSRSSNGGGEGIRMCVDCLELRLGVRTSLIGVGDEGGTVGGNLLVCFAGGAGGCSRGVDTLLDAFRPGLTFARAGFFSLLPSRRN